MMMREKSPNMFQKEFWINCNRGQDVVEGRDTTSTRRMEGDDEARGAAGGSDRCQERDGERMEYGAVDGQQRSADDEELASLFALPFGRAPPFATVPPVLICWNL